MTHPLLREGLDELTEIYADEEHPRMLVWRGAAELVVPRRSLAEKMREHRRYYSQANDALKKLSE